MKSMSELLTTWRTPEERAIRDGVAAGLKMIGADERVVVLSADLAESVKIHKFAEDYPDRFVEVGVAEQNMAGVAAGMAFVGYIPFMASYATFSPGRNWEQIRVSIALSKANVKIIGSHAGVSVGVNGPSHMGTEDIALMRVLPNMTVLVPADASQCAQAIVAALNHDGPVYIRTTRPKSALYTNPEREFKIGKIYRYREGEQLTIAACGIQVYTALNLAETLAKEGIDAEVLNVSTVKPLDRNTLYASVAKTKRVVTIEDHQIMGGMGSAVTEFVSREVPVPVLRLGIKDQFGISGKTEEIYQRMGLTEHELLQEIRQFVVE